MSNLAADLFERAMSSNNLDNTIRELDACLCANPEPQLAMTAYSNLATMIWKKFRFNERDGSTIPDDEYLWVTGCNILARRARQIYKSLPRNKQLEAGPIEVEQAMKRMVNATISYGSTVYRYGQREWRKTSGLPALRCLTEISMTLNN